MCLLLFKAIKLISSDVTFMSGFQNFKKRVIYQLEHQWFAPPLLQSACRSILRQDTKPWVWVCVQMLNKVLRQRKKGLYECVCDCSKKCFECSSVQLEGLRLSKAKPSRYLQVTTSCFSTPCQSKKPPHSPYRHYERENFSGVRECFFQPSCEHAFGRFLVLPFFAFPG